MEKRRQANEVPQWVRDFISRQQQLEETKWQLSYNTYLLNSFNEDEVEAIRAGVWKLREEASTAYTKESGFASGFSLNDPMFEPYLHKLLLTPMNRREMQEAVAKYYGWEHWSEDPWGDLYRFDEWLGTTKDNELAIWAVNDTAGGRIYLAYNIVHLVLAQEDYSKWSPDDMLDAIRLGSTNWRLVQAYSGWEEFKYPKEPLPTPFINEEITRVYTKHRFMMYRQMIVSIYLWRFVLKEMLNQIAEHPELEALLEYAVAIDPKWLEAFRSITPKGQPVPDKNEGLRRLEEAMRQPLKKLSLKYRDIFPPRSQVNGEDSAVTESYDEAMLGLFKGAEYWASKKHWVPGPEGDEYWEVKDLFIAAGLEGRLLPSLLTIAKRDLKDAAKKERLHRKRELPESQIDARRESQEEEVDTPFLDTIPSPEPTPEELMLLKEPIDLKSLVLNIDELKPVELLLLNDVCDAKNKDIPLTKYWGKDYTKKIKRLNRLRPKLKKP